MLVLTNAAARALDRAAQERFGIPGIVLMENAAIGMAAMACSELASRAGSGVGSRVAGRRVLIVCGPGNNGGDGYAIARHLVNAGCTVALIPIGAARDGSDAARNASIARRMRIPQASVSALASRPDLVIDALFGTGLDRDLTGEALDAVHAINRSAAPILAVDLPSGLDADTGKPLGCAVRATATAITVAPRLACSIRDASQYLGRWQVVGIGCPASLIEEFATATG